MSTDPYTITALDNLEENVPFGHTTADGLSLVLIRRNDEVRAWQGFCPHQGADLSDGIVEDGRLTCSLHGWRFDLETGKRDRGRACLKSYECRVVDGQVMLNPDELQVEKKKTATRTLKQLPGPRGWPLIGKIINPKDLHLELEAWAEDYPGLFRVTIAGKTWVVVSQPPLIREILMERPHPWRRVFAIEDVLTELHLRGVFAVEGETWKRHRRLVMPAFNNKHMKNYYPSLKNIAANLRNLWLNAARTGHPVEVVKDLTRFTVDVTCKLAFGYDMKMLEGSGNQLQEQMEVIFPAVSFRASLPIPLWRYLKLPMDYKLDRAIAGVLETITEIIDRTRREMDREQGPQTLLEAMLMDHEMEDGERLTDEELVGNVVTILMAGEDTTANTLAWIMYYFATYPEVQERAREEVDQALEKGCPIPEFSDTRNLPYLDAVAKEALRMKSVTPVLMKEPIADTVLGDVTIPAGTPVFTLMRFAGMKDHYVNEAAYFKPERWLPGNEALRPPDEVFLPFGSGPRLCPGRSLAFLEIKMVMAMICASFVVRTVPGAEPVREIYTFTMSPEGLNLILEPRHS